MRAKNKMQPMIIDNNGVIRFKENEIVRYLLNNGGIDLNKITLKEFSKDDRAQFAQLIGYSFSGFGELEYVKNKVYNKAKKKYNKIIEKLKEKKLFDKGK